MTITHELVMPDRLAQAREQALNRCRKSDGFYFLCYIRKGVRFGSITPYLDNDGKCYKSIALAVTHSRDVGFWAFFDIAAGKKPVLVSCVTGQTDLIMPANESELATHLSPSERC